MSIDREHARKASEVFLDPSPLYGWSDIVTGVEVGGRTWRAVETNTFRGFHRLDKSRPGAKPVFEGYFIRHRDSLLADLRAVRTERDLDTVSDRAVAGVAAELEGIVKPSQLGSYNKVRKPVDLYVEHLVAMAEEFDRGDRERLVPLLFLPLDSQMMGDEECLSDSELRRHGLSRRSTSGDVAEKGAYDALQAALATRARRVSDGLGVPFHRVYFDLAWNDRRGKQGGNLFALNPG